MMSSGVFGANEIEIASDDDRGVWVIPVHFTDQTD